MNYEEANRGQPTRPFFLMATTFATALTASASAAIIYVDADASPGRDGTSSDISHLTFAWPTAELSEHEFNDPPRKPKSLASVRNRR